MMDAFMLATAWHHQAFLRTANGDYWRVWFEGREPLMEKLTNSQITGDYKEALELIIMNI